MLQRAYRIVRWAVVGLVLLYAAAARPAAAGALEEPAEASRNSIAAAIRILKDPAFTPREQAEFVDAFARFLGMYYLGELQKRYTDERVRIESQEIISPARARVSATLVWMERAIPVEIRKLKSRGRWRAYDLSVFGISAVQIYRAQLADILRTRSPADVIALVRSRTEE